MKSISRFLEGAEGGDFELEEAWHGGAGDFLVPESRLGEQLLEEIKESCGVVDLDQARLDREKTFAKAHAAKKKELQESNRNKRLGSKAAREAKKTVKSESEKLEGLQKQTDLIATELRHILGHWHVSHRGLTAPYDPTPCIQAVNAFEEVNLLERGPEIGRNEALGATEASKWIEELQAVLKAAMEEETRGLMERAGERNKIEAAFEGIYQEDLMARRRSAIIGRRTFSAGFDEVAERLSGPHKAPQAAWSEAALRMAKAPRGRLPRLWDEAKLSLSSVSDRCLCDTLESQDEVYQERSSVLHALRREVSETIELRCIWQHKPSVIPPPPNPIPPPEVLDRGLFKALENDSSALVEAEAQFRARFLEVRDAASELDAWFEAHLVSLLSCVPELTMAEKSRWKGRLQGRGDLTSVGTQSGVEDTLGYMQKLVMVAVTDEAGQARAIMRWLLPWRRWGDVCSTEPVGEGGSEGKREKGASKIDALVFPPIHEEAHTTGMEWEVGVEAMKRLTISERIVLDDQGHGLSKYAIEVLSCLTPKHISRLQNELNTVGKVVMKRLGDSEEAMFDASRHFSSLMETCPPRRDNRLEASVWASVELTGIEEASQYAEGLVEGIIQQTESVLRKEAAEMDRRCQAHAARLLRDCAEAYLRHETEEREEAASCVLKIDIKRDELLEKLTEALTGPLVPEEERIPGHPDRLGLDPEDARLASVWLIRNYHDTSRPHPDADVGFTESFLMGEGMQTRFAKATQESSSVVLALLGEFRDIVSNGEEKKKPWYKLAPADADKNKNMEDGDAARGLEQGLSQAGNSFVRTGGAYCEALRSRLSEFFSHEKARVKTVLSAHCNGNQDTVQVGLLKDAAYYSNKILIMIEREILRALDGIIMALQKEWTDLRLTIGQRDKAGLVEANSWLENMKVVSQDKEERWQEGLSVEIKRLGISESSATRYASLMTKSGLTNTAALSDPYLGLDANMLRGLGIPRSDANLIAMRICGVSGRLSGKRKKKDVTGAFNPRAIDFMLGGNVAGEESAEMVMNVAGDAVKGAMKAVRFGIKQSIEQVATVAKEEAAPILESARQMTAASVQIQTLYRGTRARRLTAAKRVAIAEAEKEAKRLAEEKLEAALSGSSKSMLKNKPRGEVKKVLSAISEGSTEERMGDLDDSPVIKDQIKLNLNEVSELSDALKESIELPP